jgi:hypothetical protein
LAAPDWTDAEVFQIVSQQLRQCRCINDVSAKRLLMLRLSETVEPCRNAHALLPDAVSPRNNIVLRIVGGRNTQRGFSKPAVNWRTLSDPAGASAIRWISSGRWN